MRKRILLILAVIAVAILAFGAGILVQRKYQSAPIHAAEAMMRGLTGLDRPVPPAPAWDEWKYPNSRLNANILGSSLRVMEDLVRPAGRYAVFTTTDELQDVARFYANKAGFDNQDGVAKSRSATSSEGTLQGESNHLLDDFEVPGDPPTLRPVQVKCMLRRCPSYDLSVFLSRAERETHTHIILLYDPKTETRAE